MKKLNLIVAAVCGLMCWESASAQIAVRADAGLTFYITHGVHWSFRATSFNLGYRFRF